jgi:FkbM family methyltransferase
MDRSNQGLGKSMERPEPGWGHYEPRGMAALALAGLKLRIVRGLLKKPLFRFIESYGDAHDVEYDGVKLRCHLADNATERSVFSRGTGSRGLRLLVRNLQPGDVFVDAGANCGVFSAYAARAIGPAGRVISIEPNPVMLSRLRFNIAANGFGNVTVIEAALGETEGTANLRVPASNYGGASLDNETGGLQVRVMTLAAALQAAGVDHVDMLKIDIEGYEDRALLPYIRSMPRANWPKRILIEVVQSHLWHSDCVGALQSAGYREIWSDGRDNLLLLDD